MGGEASERAPPLSPAQKIGVSYKDFDSQSGLIVFPLGSGLGGEEREEEAKRGGTEVEERKKRGEERTHRKAKRGGPNEAPAELGRGKPPKGTGNGGCTAEPCPRGRGRAVLPEGGPGHPHRPKRHTPQH